MSFLQSLIEAKARLEAKGPVPIAIAMTAFDMLRLRNELRGGPHVETTEKRWELSGLPIFLKADGPPEPLYGCDQAASLATGVTT